MKKINQPVDKLALSQETIANLSEEQLQEIEGGISGDTRMSCIAMSCCFDPETEVAN